MRLYATGRTRESSLGQVEAISVNVSLFANRPKALVEVNKFRRHSGPLDNPPSQQKVWGARGTAPSNCRGVHSTRSLTCGSISEDGFAVGHGFRQSMVLQVLRGPAPQVAAFRKRRREDEFKYSAVVAQWQRYQLVLSWHVDARNGWCRHGYG